MEFVYIIAAIVLVVLICMCCCKRKQKPMFNAPVLITSTTHQTVPYAATGPQHITGNIQQMPPYPTGGMPPPAGFTPYPTQPAAGYGSAMPMPMPHTGPPVTGYPPYPTGNTTTPYPIGQPSVPHENANPPSYDQVVGHEGYQKQAPFNPQFSGN